MERLNQYCFYKNKNKTTRSKTNKSSTHSSQNLKQSQNKKNCYKNKFGKLTL